MAITILPSAVYDRRETRYIAVETLGGCRCSAVSMAFNRVTAVQRGRSVKAAADSG